jgi:hypothetical protein
MAQLFNYDPSGNKKEEVEEEESVQITAENNEIVASEPFWKVYTPMNVLREIKHRLSNN